MADTERVTPATGADFESFPLTRTEYISALVHLYRGQLSRADAWRTRLDTTSNWAIVTTMGLLSYSFGGGGHTHHALLVGMVMVTHFLLVEARRYRVFDLWNARVRMIEENFYGPILTRDLASKRSNWGRLVAGDLLTPSFKISFAQAFRARLLRNYLALYLLLIFAWTLKVIEFAHSEGGTLRQAMAFGPVPWWVTLPFVAALYSFLVAVALLVPRVQSADSELWQPHEGLDERL